MKNLNKIILVLSLFGSFIFFNPCTSVEPPQITMHELGYENSKTAKRGTDLHIDAEIIADGKIKTVMITIHPEMETGEEGFEVEKTFTKFEGYKNTSFHEHIEIDADAEAGEYHFHLEVLDLEGNTGSYEADIEITE
jgi:hypothetical protein